MKRRVSLWERDPVLWIAGMVIIVIGLYQLTLIPRLMIIAYLGILALMANAVWIEHRLQKRRRERVSPLRLGKQRDFSSLRGLVDLLRRGSEQEKREARRLLIHLLPVLQKSHAEHFPASVQVQLIDIALGQNLDEYLAHAVLKALQIVGSPHVFVSLQEARSQSWTQTQANLNLVTQLERGLKILDERRNESDSRSYLLRPSHLESPDLLVRPSTSVAGEPETLLLPVEPNGERHRK